MVRDLFDPVVPLEKTHPLFRRMLGGPGHEAARQMMNAVFADFHDVDKTFIRQFQTTGFPARVLELALFAYLQDQDLELDRTQAAPDFVVRGEHPVASDSEPLIGRRNGWSRLASWNCSAQRRRRAMSAGTSMKLATSPGDQPSLGLGAGPRYSTR
jgi:hypothetical protein